jgi:catechol 2,3-dioxygenase-like lactoylglutathione lyase family enzyme
MSLLIPGGVNTIPVRNLEAATAWYIEKLSLRKIDVEMDNPEGCQALGFSTEEWAVTLVPPGEESSEELTPRFYASNVKKTRQYLVTRDILVGEIQQDGQGTHYFEFQDLEGNKIEVCEEP